MGQFDINSGISDCPDPTGWIPEGLAEVATYTDGAPLLQGLERGTLVWNCLTYAQWYDLWDAYRDNHDSLVSGTLPEENGSGLGTYDTVTTAYWHEPQGEARGGLWFNVRMYVSHITRA